MALPLDNPNPKTDAVETEIKKMGPKDLAALPDLDDDDFKVIGALIQYFCFMDLNLRRALETFHAAKMLPKDYQKLYPNLPDAKLTEALAAIVSEMDAETEDIETSLMWLQVIDSTRLKRNLAGHFAGKRFPGHDVYVFASKSEKDAKKVLGFGLAQHEVQSPIRSEPLRVHDGAIANKLGYPLYGVCKVGPSCPCPSQLARTTGLASRSMRASISLRCWSLIVR